MLIEKLIDSDLISFPAFCGVCKLKKIRNYKNITSSYSPFNLNTKQK